jgi:WD40 repeat protein
LLGLYQQVLGGAIAANDSAEQRELRLTGLVVKRAGALRLYNPIYARVFDAVWVERALAELRPYGAAIAAWVASGCEDESRLLRGQALVEAQGWAEGKRLGDEDYRFLAASQGLETRAIEARLAVAVEEKGILAAAEATAQKRLRSAGCWVKGSAVVAVFLLAVAGGLGLYGRRAWEEQQVAVAVTKLEREGSAAVELTKKRPLEGLLRAMRSGESLQQLMQQKRTSEYLTGSPVYALQQALETTKYQTLLAHPAGITQMVVTPKGDRIITVGEDNVIREWDVAGNLTNHIKIGDQFKNIEISPNGDRIVLYHPTEASIKVIDSGGRLIKEFHGDATLRIMFSPAGDRIFTYEREYRKSDDGKSLTYTSSIMRMFDNSFNLITQFDSPSGYWLIDNSHHVYMLFSLKKNLFAIITANGIIEVRDLSGNIFARLSGVTGRITGINFNSSGDKIIAASNDGSAKVWDLTKQTISTLKRQAGDERSLDARFSPQNNQMLTTAGRNIKLWSSSGELIETFRGHHNKVTSAQFNHDGKYVISSSLDGTIKVWGLEGNILFNSLTPLNSLSPLYAFKYPVLLKGSQVLVEGLNNSAYIWNLSKQISEQYIERPESESDGYGLSINSSLDRILIVSKSYQSAKILDVVENVVSKFSLPNMPEAKITGNFDRIHWSFSRDNQHVVATTIISKKRHGPPDLTTEDVKLNSFSFDLQGRFLKVIKNSTFADAEIDVRDIDASTLPQIDSSGKYILTSTGIGRADYPGTIFLSTKLGQKLFEVDGKRPQMNPKRSLLLTHNDNSTVKVWGFSGQLVAEFKQNQPYLSDVKFNSSGDRVIMLFENGDIQTHPIETLPQMLKRGCTWLRSYLDANPTELDQLPTCKAQYAKTPPKP